MIKINKDLSAIPKSLKIPKRGKPTTTHSRRLEVINHGSYISEKKYNSRYKMQDIKEVLITIYNNKCAYCEQHVEQLQVEHYRPKKIYYWLAFSWDNLLLVCPACNQYKAANFEIVNTRCECNEEDLNQINTCSDKYDDIEKPLLVNPEVTDPTGKITFNKYGIPSSDDPRFDYTIKTCHLDRKSLNDQRRKILDKFRNHIRSVSVKSLTDNDKRVSIENISSCFISDSQDLKENFLCFRQYAIQWLNDIIKEIRNGN